MTVDISGEVAVVTGASSGIGRATCETLASEGTSVVLAARSEEAITEHAKIIRQEYDVETLAVPTDITEFDAVENLIETAVDRFGRIDIVVNNAGTSGDGSVADMPLETYQTMTGVNIDGAFYTTKLALPYLREGSGNVIFIGSFAGNYPRPKFPVYAATKWWIKGFALSLAGKYGSDDIGVTLVNPTAVRTNFESNGTTFKEQYSHDEAIEPEEIAELVATAAKQRSPVSLNSIDIYDQEKLSHF